MSERRVLVVGSGKRVREAALPALAHMQGDFTVAGVYARTAKQIEASGREYDVRPLDELAPSDLDGVDLVYLAVTKDAVPAVLARFAAMDVGAIDCLIDTPVVRFKHFRHASQLAVFRNAWVAEDCVYLPWIETVRAARDAGLFGSVQRIEFDRSAYAYHGIATAKALLAARRVRSARRQRRDAETALRTLRFAEGGEVHVVEPRDYSRGRLRIVGSAATVSDHPDDGATHQLQPQVVAGAWSGFRIGDITTELDDAEVELGSGPPEGDTVIARMDAMKRVGFLRLLRSIHAGRGGYPVEEALDDMVIDYHLEKVGRYVANPFTSARSGLARMLLGTLSRLGG